MSFIFLFRRLAKRDAVEPPLAKTNDYDYQMANPEQSQKAKRDAPAPYAYPNDYHVAAAYPGPAPVTKINIVEYVQLFS